MSSNDGKEIRKILAETFKPIDPTLRTFIPINGPESVDPGAKPSITIGDPVGGKPPEGTLGGGTPGNSSFDEAQSSPGKR